jgi:TM2 domain-containing membrane protein YozV
LPKLNIFAAVLPEISFLLLWIVGMTNMAAESSAPVFGVLAYIGMAINGWAYFAANFIGMPLATFLSDGVGAPEFMAMGVGPFITVFLVLFSSYFGLWLRARKQKKAITAKLSESEAINNG